jgi:P-type Mg2+ transporter
VHTGEPPTTVVIEAFWAQPLAETFRSVGAQPTGLTGAEAARRLATEGANTIEEARSHRGRRLLLVQFTNPIMLILAAATVLSMVLGDLVDGAIILVIITASGLLGFWQEHNAGHSVEALLARVRVEVEVLRDGREVAVPAEDVVPGDVLALRAGRRRPRGRADPRLAGPARG